MHSRRLKLSKIKYPIGVREISRKVHKTTKRKSKRRQKNKQEETSRGSILEIQYLTNVGTRKIWKVEKRYKKTSQNEKCESAEKKRRGTHEREDFYLPLDKKLIIYHIYI